MKSTENAVNKILGELSRIPSEIHSNFKSQSSEDIDVEVEKSLAKQISELKSRGIV